MKINFSEFIPKWKLPDFGKIKQTQRLVDILPDALLQKNGLTNLNDWAWLQSPERQAILPAPENNRIPLDFKRLRNGDWQFVKGLAMEPAIPRIDGWGQQEGAPIVRRLLLSNKSDPLYKGQWRGIFNPNNKEVSLMDYVLEENRPPKTFFHEFGHARDRAGLFTNDMKDTLMWALQNARKVGDEAVDKTLEHINRPYYSQDDSPFIKEALQIAKVTTPEGKEKLLDSIRRSEAVAEFHAQKKLKDYALFNQQLIPRRFGLADEPSAFDSLNEYYSMQDDIPWIGRV